MTDRPLSIATRARLGMASIELSPRQIEKDQHLLGSIPGGVRVYIVDTGNTDIAAWRQAVLTVTAAGLRPVPHLAARRIVSRDALAARLDAMTGEGRIHDALVVAGGAVTPSGPFRSSMDLLATGLIERCGIRRLGIAGHPEGSPDIGSDQIDAALRWKLDWSKRSGTILRIVTQFGFDVGKAIAWSEGLAARGSTLPVHLGIAGPTGLSSLLKYAAMCGVKTSMSVSARRGSALSALVTSYTPEPFAQAIDSHLSRVPQTPIAQLHVYPFGGLAATAHWLRGRGTWPSVIDR